MSPVSRQSHRGDALRGAQVHQPTETETDRLLPVAALTNPENGFLILLRSPRFMVAIVSLFAVNSIGTGFDGVLPAYVHDAFDLNTMHAALFFLAMALPMLLSPVSGAIADRYGARWPASCGSILAATSLMLLRLVTQDTSLPFVKLGGLLFLFGLATAFILPPLMAEISVVVDETETRNPGIFGAYGGYSQAYGLMNTAFAAGSMVGPLYAGFVRAWLGWPAMSLIMSLLSLAVLLAVLAGTGEGGFLVEKEHKSSSNGSSSEST